MRTTQKLMLSVMTTLVSLGAVSAEPYTFTPQDYIEYGIYFSPKGYSNSTSSKLLTLRAGDINGYYSTFFPDFKDVPTERQSLRLKTARGSVIVNRKDSEGLVVTRDTHNSRKRRGTKLLDVTFENGTCSDASGVTSSCVVHLELTTKKPDRFVTRQPRLLKITTSTGLSFRYKSLLVDGSKPFPINIEQYPVINNFAWEWRPSLD